eukprot:6764186-Karenia_brevis.AAC.1
MCNAVKWLWHFTHNSGDDNGFDWYRFLHMKSSGATTFSKCHPPELDWYCTSLENAINDCYRMAKSKVACGRLHDNVAPIVREGVKWLKHAEWCALPTDKDGGFCMVLRSDVQYLLQKQMPEHTYEPVYEWAINFSNLNREASSVVKEIAKFEDSKKLKDLLFRSFNKTPTS